MLRRTIRLAHSKTCLDSVLPEHCPIATASKVPHFFAILRSMVARRSLIRALGVALIALSGTLPAPMRAAAQAPAMPGRSSASVPLTGTGSLATQTATTISLTITSGSDTATTIAAGNLVTLTAKVTAGGMAVTPGVVSFCDATIDACAGSGVLGAAQLTSAGTATLQLFPGVGSHSYKAVLAETAAYASSASSLQPLTVTGSTATTISSSGSTGNYTLTGSVSVTGGAVAPTGTVTFSDSSNSFSLGTATLGTGQSALSLLNAPSAPSLGTWSPYVTAVGDFNGDGKLDLAVVDAASGPSGQTPGNALFIFLGKGDGTFTTGPATPLANMAASAVAAGDFNNDGKTDLAVLNVDNSVSILLGNGDGTFSLVSSSSEAGSDPAYVTLADFNGDGNLDLAVANGGGNTVTILLGNGDGTFTGAPSNPEVASEPMFVAAGDFNGDGKMDLAVASFNTSAVSILLGNGDGTFTSGTSLSVAGSLVSAPGDAIAIGDFNSDGKIDLAVESLTQSGSSQTMVVGVFLGKGDGTFEAQPTLQIPGDTNAYSIAAADFNSDGKTDLVVFDDQTVTIFRSNGDGTFNAAATGAGSASSPDNDYIAIGDFNSDGTPDVVLADSDLNVVNVLLVKNTETAAATLDGVSIPGSGAHNVTAAYGGAAALSSSTSSAIQLSASLVPTTLTLSASATSLSSGQQVTLTAILKPYDDQVLTTNGEAVSFLSGGKVLGTGSLASGVATLNTTSLTVGTDSIVATYGGDSSFGPATASTVSIVVGAPVPRATLSPASLTFAAQNTGTSSAAETVTLTNSGAAALNITSIAASGDFAETNTCGASVAAGANCTISVTFTPTAGGSRAGTLTITDNASGSPQTVSLTGAGSTVTQTPASSSLSISSTGGSATDAIQLSPEGGFSGTVNLTCAVTYQGSGSATDAPTCSLSPAQAQVASGSTVSTTLTIATTASGSAHLFNPFPPIGGGVLAAVLFFTGVPRRRWRGWSLLAVLGVVIAGTCLGCGGNGGGSGNNPPPNPGTTTGNYSVTVKATSGTMMSSVSIPLTVQ